jgi:hypothetical protein
VVPPHREGDDLQRLVWFTFGDGHEQPDRVVKCSRVRETMPPSTGAAALDALESLPQS